MTTDYLLQEEDLIIENGDFKSGDSVDDHVNHILVATKGQYRQHPLVGVGLLNYIGSPWTSTVRNRLESQIQLQLEADGATGVDISIDGTGKLSISNVKYP
ncbi:MAG: hypothetical protein EP346_00020 [Bacteroidetes bacterium]|nr:MAG: hypothetical protein EP346_00020 [Bacteroidota bacterium]